MSEAERWLRSRLPATPEPLMRSMVDALSGAAGSVPDALAEGAITLYARVVRGSGGREDALPLLAADALLTHAFHAQAELDPTGLASVAERFGAGGRLREVVA